MVQLLGVTSVRGGFFFRSSVPGSGFFVFRLAFVRGNKDLQFAVNILTGVNFDVRTIPESWIFLQDIPTFPFGSQYDENLPKLADEFRKRPFVMLENDSVVVTGDKLINTFDRLEVADFSARSLILAAPLGSLKPITDSEIEDLRVAFHVGE